MERFLLFLVLAVFINSHLYAKPLHSPRIKRNALRDLRLHWPEGIVPYTISNVRNETEREAIYQAMKDIHSVSCVRFIPRSDEKDYVRIRKGTRCSADTGRIGGSQRLILRSKCMKKGTIIHELFHTLGFHHEHARPDRDKYIKVHESNVSPSTKLKNFLKLSSVNVTTLDLPYDYRSVLHYSSNAFAIDSQKKTLTALNGNEEISHPTEMSFVDILRLNRLYPCRRNRKWGPWIRGNRTMV